MNGGDSALEKLKHSVVGWLGKSNSATDKCVDQSLNTVYGITLLQLFQPHFQLKQEHRLRHFEQEMRTCTGTTEKRKGGCTPKGCSTRYMFLFFSCF